MSTQIKVGDVVTLRDLERHWRVVYIDEELRYARLEFMGEAMVRSRIFNLDDLHPYSGSESHRVI